MITTLIGVLFWVLFGYFALGAFVVVYWWQEELDEPWLPRFLTDLTTYRAAEVAVQYALDHWPTWAWELHRRVRRNHLKREQRSR